MASCISLNAAFDGSYAEVGDAVIVMTGDGIGSGTIDSITQGTPDDVWIWFHRDQRARNDYTFVATANAAAVDSMQPGEWTWKP